MNSPETKDKYVTRLNRFFDYIGLSQITIQHRCKEFVDKSKGQPSSRYAINSVIRFLQMNKDRVQKKEITGATARSRDHGGLVQQALVKNLARNQKVWITIISLS